MNRRPAYSSRPQNQKGQATGPRRHPAPTPYARGGRPQAPRNQAYTKPSPRRRPYPERPKAPAPPRYRNTLGGDPYEESTAKPTWLKWLAPILSGLVFIACLIALIVLLS